MNYPLPSPPFYENAVYLHLLPLSRHSAPSYFLCTVPFSLPPSMDKALYPSPLPVDRSLLLSPLPLRMHSAPSHFLRPTVGCSGSLLSP